jgi:hypothetical protein
MTPLTRTSMLIVVLLLPAWSVARDNEQFSRLPESVARVERETGGKVLQVKPIQRGDREIYRMKVLTPEGRVKVMQDDPRHPREFSRDEEGVSAPKSGDDDATHTR